MAAVFQLGRCCRLHARLRVQRVEALRSVAAEAEAHPTSGARIGPAASPPGLAQRISVGFGALSVGVGSVAALAWWQLPRIQAVLHSEPEEAPSLWERLMGPSHPADRIFDKADVDRDGHLDRRELAQYMMTCGIMDMSGFNAIWEEINTESSDAISREEFRSFHDNAERNFYLSLWRSLVSDPSFMGSALYLSGSVLFAAMPYWSLASPATMTKMGQAILPGAGLNDPSWNLGVKTIAGHLLAIQGFVTHPKEPNVRTLHISD
ncbi:unnamed protein product [Symbiodinium natans]|uniref:EF-hand domain-containing protein n=1 Tax=Symbiodinium natans TaxID=878477 RepID=A0A812HZX7_9DINO|nr:unnamed protein product [Symbiodinium natans]